MPPRLLRDFMQRLAKPLLIGFNTAREQPGLITRALTQRWLNYVLVDFNDCNGNLEPRNYSAVIVMGGPDSANDSSPKILIERDFVQRTVEEGVPYLGICLGMQVLVKATGGLVRANSVKEVGLRGQGDEYFLVKINRDGQQSALLRNVQNMFPVFQLHGETVDLVEGQKLLATGTDCHVQAVQVGKNAFGVQFHPELTLDMLDVWLNEDPDLARLDRSALRLEYISLSAALQFHGTRIIENFIAFVESVNQASK